MIKRLLLPLLPAALFAAVMLFIEPIHRPVVADPADVAPLPPITDPDGRLGVAYGFYEDPPDSGQRPYLDLMFNAGARHDRWDFSWWAIQPDHQNQWNWSGHERVVRAENSRGVNVLGILLWTPQWAAPPVTPTAWLQRLTSLAAADPRSYAHASGPLGPAGPAPFNSLPPTNLEQPVFINGQINPENYWGYFVYNVAKHFDNQTDAALQVNAWEIWNEVEGDFFWSGSAQDYCQLLQVAYKAIKGTDGAVGGNPDATVLFAGLHYWAKPTRYTQVLDCLAAADPGGTRHNYFFDVMSVHFYSRSDDAYNMVNLIKSGMAARGMGDHPIWLTETGAPLYGDASPGRTPPEKRDFYLSTDQQAAYTIQSYANALAAGVERYYFFRAHDADMSVPHGLIRNDHSLRPAYAAYQVAAQYLRRENQITRVQTGASTRVSLWGTPNGKVSVLWNRTPDPVSYTLRAAVPTATLVDRRGVTKVLGAVNGHYTVTLPGATANLVSNPNDYIVGGDPLILVETDTRVPTSSLAPLPAVTKGYVISLTLTTGDIGSGVWYTLVQASTSPDGPWTTFARLEEPPSTTRILYTGQHGVTYYFRARARDRVGNWESWPAGFDVSTSVDADTEFRLHIDTLFNDSNRNGVWDPNTGGNLKPEIALTQVSMRFVDEQGHTITSRVGSSWHFTTTLLPGTYAFIAEWEDVDGDEWGYEESWSLDGKVDPLHAPATDKIGLLRRQEVYLPLLFRRSSN